MRNTTAKTAQIVTSKYQPSYDLGRPRMNSLTTHIKSKIKSIQSKILLTYFRLLYGFVVISLIVSLHLRIS